MNPPSDPKLTESAGDEPGGPLSSGFSRSIQPVAVLRTCFDEKFGVPRQSGVIAEAKGVVEFLPGFDMVESVQGLEAFSHLWLLTGFHLSPEWTKRRSTVRPPRLGGNQRVGVWASRAPCRPNGLGLSVVKLDRIDVTGGRARLEVSGVDAVDGTPVYDVKPYLPYADRIADARAEWAPVTQEAGVEVVFQEDAQHAMGSEMRDLLVAALSRRPWPAYQEPDPRRVYHFRLAGHEISFFRTGENEVLVTEMRRRDRGE